MSFEHLRLEREAGTLSITIDRQAKLNALNTALTDELRRAVLESRRNDDVRAVILTGAGEKAFVAGADIAEMAALTPAQARDYAQRGQHLMDLIESMGKPVIAAVNGYALGGGCELAMACTFRIASETSVFGQPEIDLGLIPGYAGTQRLSRLVGRSRALELILTGRRVKAEEALAIGLVDRVVPAASLMAEARAMAAAMAAKPAVAVRYAMQAVTRGLEMPFADAAMMEASLFGLAFATEDMREGTTAFLEKRKPAFKGK
jgi:enoyl-CoA hydratase